MRNIQRHFSTVAERYRELRTTDIEPIIYIKEALRENSLITAADIGCGAGRYDMQLFHQFGDRLFLYCVDAKKNMLRQLQEFLGQAVPEKFEAIRASAHKIPLLYNSLDAVFTFNAIHHFQLPLFFREVFRILKPGGKVFVYTRLENQNRRTIWGQFFPLFNEKETRLYRLEEL